jgi:hypothetical protein
MVYWEQAAAKVAGSNEVQRAAAPTRRIREGTMSTHHSSTEQLAAAHRAELERAAEQARLAAEAAGARPSILGALLAALGGLVARPEPQHAGGVPGVASTSPR